MYNSIAATGQMFVPVAYILYSVDFLPILVSPPGWFFRLLVICHGDILYTYVVLFDYEGVFTQFSQSFRTPCAEVEL